MEVNKLIDKTKEVIKKQQEFNDVVDELKLEVKDVFMKNKQLNEENILLKQRISKYEKVEAKEEQSNTAENESIKAQIKKPLDVEEIIIEKVETEEVVITDVQQDKVKPVVHKKSNALFEFFLGKNVIAKIATVLIFLGILTFGQMAYVDWLNDVGRVFLIMFTGFVFFGIAYFSEKKNILVFSNVFYSLSIFIVYYSLILAHFSFSLVNGHILSYLVLLLMASVFTYFRNKRYEFLDTLLFLFYFIAGTSMIFYFDISGKVSSYFEIILFVTALGYISFVYLKNYYENNDVINSLLQSIYTIGLSIYLFNFVFLTFRNDEFTSIMGLNLLSYSLLSLFLVYIFNIGKKMNNLTRYNIFTVLYTVFMMVAISYGIVAFISTITIFNITSFVALIFIILSSPLYAILYLRYKDGEDNFSNQYLVFLAIVMLIFSFTVGPFKENKFASYSVQNLILGLEILLFYVLSKFTKDKMHRLIWIVFTGILIFKNVIYYTIEGEFLFNEGLLIFTNLTLGVLLVTLHEVFKRTNIDKNQTDNTLVHCANIILLLPFFITFVNDLISTELAFIFAIVLVVFIGYRWITEIKFFDIEEKHKIISGLNIGIVLLVLFLNLFYFDHNFKIFSDVLKFFILLVFNGYTVFVIKELYQGINMRDEHKEVYFIGAYLLGVLIHSLFIHNYINIEFDKVILSSYFLIASAIGVLLGFRMNWSISRRLGLFAIYYSLAKFFVYDMYSQDFSAFVRMVTYFVLGSILLGISFLYAYLEKIYGKELE